MTTFTNLPPPSFYQDKLHYAYEWSDYQKTLQPAVPSIFDLAFTPADILVACTSTGELCFFRLPHSSTADDEDNQLDDNNHSPDVSSQSVTKNKTYCWHRFHLTHSSLYSLKVNQEADRTWLVVGGDGGVWLLDWNDIEESILQQQTSSPKHQHFPLHPSPHEAAVEVNETCFRKGNLWGAAGDEFGCYKWNVETGTIVATYPSKYLQTMTLVPNTNLLLTGGEEGTLSMWDTQQDRLVEHIEIHDVSLSNTTEKRDSLLSHRTRITSAIARDENWWTVGGERTRHTRSQAGSDKNGFLATIHGPTRSIVSQIELRETPQKLAYINHNYKEALVSVANESYVSHFNSSLLLEHPERVWCHSPSVFAAAVSEQGILAVAGAGSTIDLYRNQTELIGTLRL